MDCSWLHEDVAENSSNSETDLEETQTELESRLYGIVHHNDLSQPLEPELAKHYSIHCADNGELLVSLKDTLDEIKSEECKKFNSFFESPETKQESTTGTVIKCPDENDTISVINNTEIVSSSSKRFRYSDVNLDSPSQSLHTKAGDEAKTPGIIYYEFRPSNFNPKTFREFSHLKIPLSLNSTNWKIEANASYISINNNICDCNAGPEIISKMVVALKEVNPTEKHKTLYRFANLLLKKNLKAHKRRERKRRKQTMKKETLNDIQILDLSQEMKNNQLNKEIQHDYTGKNDQVIKNQSKNRSKQENRHSLNGSISLNISAFKPDLPMVDLVSEDENNSPVTSKVSLSKGSQCYIPYEWSRSMIKFYTKPSRKKLEMDLNEAFKSMKKTTTAQDWWLDPRDRNGYYHRQRQMKYKGRKCSNCRESGHFFRDCTKTPTCYLCGQPFHNSYSCPNKICLKCGALTPLVETGECHSCYLKMFETVTRCEVCSQVTHDSASCTDLWRSYHSTTEGEKKIPEKKMTNYRRYCCNCALKGHFSHECQLLSYTGQQISSFVTNYSALPFQRGTTEIAIPNQYSDLVNNQDADMFLQNLSNSTKAEIMYEEKDRRCIFRISGTFEQCTRVKTEIEEFVNTRKRKRSEPFVIRKKQRLKY